jgi:Arc/MetJ-type ribon-helix-helix transcriptional regulator
VSDANWTKYRPPKRKASNCKVITINLNKTDLAALELLCGPEGVFPSRSEAVRQAVHLMVMSEEAHAVLLQRCGIEAEPVRHEIPIPQGFVMVGEHLYQLVKK